MITEGKTIGEVLRGAREERKMTVEQVHRETKISMQAIRALESDDFSSFPSDTYLKGFLRTYAEFLGLDGGRLWAMLAARPEASAGPGPSWDVEGSVRQERLGPPRLVRRLLIPLLVVAVLILVLLLLRERRREAVPVGARAPAADVIPPAAG